jgi:HtrA serine peptidase 1
MSPQDESEGPIEVLAETNQEVTDGEETAAASSTECGQCDPKTCPPAPACRAGYQTDACGCCSVCAASSGEKCDLDTSTSYKYGVCGDNLECRARTDIQSPGVSVIHLYSRL